SGSSAHSRSSRVARSGSCPGVSISLAGCQTVTGEGDHRRRISVLHGRPAACLAIGRSVAMPGYKEGSMFELIQRIPEPWRQLTDLLIAPLAWWDAVRAVWLYWLGMFRFVGVALGWAVAFSTFVAKLVLEVVRQIVLMPFTMTGRMTETYFRPGVPWVAFVMLIFWCALEAAIFTYTLMPTVTELLTDLVGGESTARFTGPILYCFLLLLVMGSFACVQTLMDAVKKREWKFIVQMVVVELFVMFFEVIFLYRELIDALTPWISQQTGMKLGLTVTLALSSFGWIGIRGMTWFLFGQFGTPPMLAFISRRPMVDEGAPRHTNGKPVPAWWRQPVA